MDENKTKIFNSLRNIAQLSQRPITSEIYTIYTEKLLKLYKPEVVLKALDKIIEQTGSGDKWPSIRDIVNVIAPPENDDAWCTLEAQKALGAIAKFGWPNEDRARTYLGEFTWDAVKHRFGGWRSFCESVNHQNETSHLAQIRNGIKAHLAQSRAENCDAPLGLSFEASKQLEFSRD